MVLSTISCQHLWRDLVNKVLHHHLVNVTTNLNILFGYPALFFVINPRFTSFDGYFSLDFFIPFLSMICTFSPFNLFSRYSCLIRVEVVQQKSL